MAFGALHKCTDGKQEGQERERIDGQQKRQEAVPAVMDTSS